MKKKNALWALLPLGIVALDQTVKLWAEQTLRKVETMPVIEGVFHLTYARNTGAAFSLLRGGRWFFVALTAGMLALLLWALLRGWVRGAVGRTAVLFIMGGAVGNLIDRVRFGYVVDLFDFRLIHFAIFNVADSFITVGGILLGVWILFLEPGERRGDHGDGNKPEGSV